MFPLYVPYTWTFLELLTVHTYAIIITLMKNALLSDVAIRLFSEYLGQCFSLCIKNSSAKSNSNRVGQKYQNSQ